MRLSRVDWDQTRALVLDYYVTVPAMPGDYTFQSGTTYLVSGPCDLVNVTLEGGAVVKYANANSCTPMQIGAWEYGTVFIVVDGTLTCQTSSDHPAVFTAVDDNNVGVQIGNGYPAGNYYANPAIYAPSQQSFSLSNVRISYAEQVVYTGGAYESDTTLTLSDLQVIDSGVMAVLGSGYGYDGVMTLTCNNCLYSGGYDGIPVLDYGNDSDIYNLNNCTIDNACYLVAGSNPSSSSGNAVNCIFADTYNSGNCSWQGGNNGIYNCNATFGSPQYQAQANPPFKSSGSDNYYLVVNPDGSDASGFRNEGTSTGIGPALLADLAVRTTYAPEDGYHPNNGVPDLGYHYAMHPWAASQVLYIPVNTGANTPVTITLNGLDIYNNTLTFAVVSAPANGQLGQLTQIPPNHASVAYTPFQNYIGADSFQFTTSYGNNISAPATVSINVIPAMQLSLFPYYDHITLQWGDPYTTVGAFYIGRSTTSGGPYTVIDSRPGNVRWYLDNTAPCREPLNLIQGQTYYYVLLGQINGSEQLLVLSDEASASTTSTLVNAPFFPVYDAQFWNDGDYIQNNNNCYDYANNVRLDRYADPGAANGVTHNDNGNLNLWEEELKQGAVADGLIPCGRYDYSPNMTRVALVVDWDVDAGYDYHWLRQDWSGQGFTYWSHKPGYGAATDLDSDGIIIQNPEEANLSPYNVFVGYFFTPAGPDPGEGNAVIWARVNK